MSASQTPNNSAQPCSCSEALRYLDRFLDHEVDAELTDRLAQHVTDCPHCGRLADAERHLRAIIRSRCAEQAPPQLRERIRMSLSVSCTEFKISGSSSGF
ncbi:mycothiol system anti-sigma-R factor [Actinomyces vulturis]|uniref:mycothiol system anti-sigma-R factor n=1 Tax=Actinomyces vulturis TaxID=1857645 RepID=UPI0008359851